MGSEMCIRDSPIRISHIPFSIRRTGSISVEMPTMGARIRVINRDGTIGSSEVRDLGIEMATNEQPLLLLVISPTDINSDATLDSGLVLVDNGAPLASYNPNQLWVLICSFQPQTGSLQEGLSCHYPEYLKQVNQDLFLTATWMVICHGFHWQTDVKRI